MSVLFINFSINGIKTEECRSFSESGFPLKDIQNLYRKMINANVALNSQYICRPDNDHRPMPFKDRHVIVI